MYICLSIAHLWLWSDSSRRNDNTLCSFCSLVFSKPPNHILCFEFNRFLSVVSSSIPIMSFHIMYTTCTNDRIKFYSHSILCKCFYRIITNSSLSIFYFCCFVVCCLDDKLIQLCKFLSPEER